MSGYASKQSEDKARVSLMFILNSVNSNRVSCDFVNNVRRVVLNSYII